MTIKHQICKCTVCGADITYLPKYYPDGFSGGVFCYECNEKRKKQKHIDRIADPHELDMILTMYKRGKKPSEIAVIMGIPAKDVMEIITTMIL